MVRAVPAAHPNLHGRWSTRLACALRTSGRLALPAYIDGIRQYEYKIESTNTRRVMTGILLGIALRLLRQSVIGWVT